jgi:glycolate oxidase
MNDVLERIFGSENISSRETDCLVYSLDSSQIEGKTKVVAWPTSKEQIMEVVKAAKGKKWDIVARGGGSGMAGGCVPQDSITLDMSKMDSMGKPDKDRKTVVAGPGVILDDLNSSLQEHGLFFPINPSSHKACSVGGMVATNAAGNAAVRYGKTADWVEEIEIISGSGEILKLKGMDLREFAGTEGILGIITEIKLKLTEPVKARTLSLKEYDEFGDMMNVVNELMDNENILSIELFDKQTAELSGLDSKYHLFIEFGSREGELKDESDIQRIWKIREDVGAILSSNDFVLMEDPQIPLEKLPEFIDWLEANKIPYFGHIALGIIHQRFKRGQGRIISEMFDLVKKLGGNVSGEHGIGLRKKEYLGGEIIMKMKRLKNKYDPEGVLNRGKII